MKRGLAIGLIVAVAVVAGVGGFFGGRATGGGAPSPAEAMKVIQNLSQADLAKLVQNGGGVGLFGGGAGGPGGTGARGAGGGFTSGSILSKDATSITVKDSSGNTKTIYYSSTTTISKSSDVSVDALTVGQDVTVTGTSNSDGSVTAARIILGSAGFGVPGQGGAPGAAGGPPASDGSGNAAPSSSAPSGSTTQTTASGK
jgi:type IV secretion system protein TrbL